MKVPSRRGQTEVLGVVFSFVIIIGLIGINQAFIVPQTNSKVEIQHDRGVQSDMVDLRGEAIEAAASNNPRTTSVKLGVRYPTRIVAKNPPPVSGTLQTEDGGNISIENAQLEEICGTDEQPDTKFWTYQADYNVYDSGLPITVENTVTHRGSNGTLTDTKQTVIRGNVIRIIRFTGDYHANGVGSRTVEMIPSETGQGVINESAAINVTLPTRMDNETWSDLLSDEIDEGLIKGVDATAVENVTITMKGPTADGTDDVDQIIVRCTTIGVDERPDVDPSSAGPIDAEPDEIVNPFGRGVVQLQSAKAVSGDIDAEFWNRNNEKRKLTEARVPYVEDPGGNADTVDLRTGPSESKTLEIGGNFTDASGIDFQIGANDNETLTIDPSPASATNTGLALKLKFEDPNDPSTNSTYTYFVADD